MATKGGSKRYSSSEGGRDGKRDVQKKTRKRAFAMPVIFKQLRTGSGASVSKKANSAIFYHTCSS